MNEWTVGANGNEFRDIGGFRYCVDYPAQRGGAFRVLRNGTEIAGPTCIGAPAGFKDAASAKTYVDGICERLRGASPLFAA
jgi:hypothetical protein